MSKSLKISTSSEKLLKFCLAAVLHTRNTTRELINAQHVPVELSGKIKRPMIADITQFANFCSVPSDFVVFAKLFQPKKPHRNT